MLDRSGVVHRLLEADARARREAEALVGPGARPGDLEWRVRVRRYVLHKFLLDEESPDMVEATCEDAGARTSTGSAGANVPATDDLGELARLSVAKAGRLSRSELELLDVSKRCGATSSAMTKKVMLLMSVQRDFHVSLARADTAAIESCAQLARVIRDAREADNHG